MQIREYSLPPGWFPRDPAGVSDQISYFLQDRKQKSIKSRAVISPHAGWFYSGRIAAVGISSLKSEAGTPNESFQGTIAVLGGHLSAASPPLFATEDAVRTPFGPMPIDKELRNVLDKELEGRADLSRDNTVEVLLPMVRFFFPQAKLLWMRLPPNLLSFKAGKIIAMEAARLGRNINVIASTDLTHYGTNYGFMPQGFGQPALRWMREENDANFIRAVESGKSDEVLNRAKKDRSACSAGAVLGAMGFAEAEGLKGAQLLEYGTSIDVQEDGTIPTSFVGYAAMAFV
ncbi:MAG: AmmeMemoRadiSam system protein B [Treponema sp.]|jgi:AmmeMemoRadiSam system protein B|nr:AmmeMemoRadiSam system protein B [Treponema sp.]